MPKLCPLQDFRTGYYTLASPKALFVAQLAGSFVGVLFAPAIYKFYTASFPFATVYRLMAVVSANGFNELPDHCLSIAGAPFDTAQLYYKQFATLQCCNA